MMPNAERVDYHSNIDFTPGSNSIVIMDESDHYTFDDPTAFLKFIKKTTCVCLTATCSEDQTGGIERDVLKNMQFKVFENIINSCPQKDLSSSFERVEAKDLEEILKAIDGEVKKQAVLLYTTTDLKE